MNKTTLFFSLVLYFLNCIIGNSLAFAKDTPTYDFVYTPKRIAEKKHSALRNVTVITKKEIEEKQYQNIQDILHTLPGVNIAQSGGAGTVSSLFYRGTNSNHSIILVDGVRIASSTTGAANLSSIPVGIIERIEAVSGANSSIYGTDAIGGVIQIFTKGAAAGKTRGELTLKTGSHNSKSAVANISTKNKPGTQWFSITANHEKTNGINACDGSAALFKGCFVDEPDDDSHRNNSVALNTGISLADDKVKLSLNALSSNNNTEYDGSSFSGNSLQGHQQNFLGKVDIKPSDNIDIAIMHGENRDKTRNFYQNNTFVSKFNSKRKNSSIISAYTNHSSKVVLGSDFMRETVDSSQNYQEDTRHSKSIFTSIQKTLGNTAIEGSYRLDDHSQYNKEETGGLSVSQQISDLKITASHQKGFHVPSFDKLYFPYSSNPNLKPETSYSNELSFNKKVGIFDTHLSFYRTKIENLIVNDSTYTPQNINRARIRGVDFSSQASIGKTNLNLQISSMSAKNKTTSDDLPRRPKTKGTLGISQKINNLLLGTEIHSQSHFREPNKKRIGGFSTIDLTAQYQLAKNITIGAKASNIGDKQYETVDFYNQPGREYHAFIKLSHEAPR